MAILPLEWCRLARSSASASAAFFTEPPTTAADRLIETNQEADHIKTGTDEHMMGDYKRAWCTRFMPVLINLLRGCDSSHATCMVEQACLMGDCNSKHA